MKASYTRSFEGAPTGGGRVTELVARPLVSLLFPKLADIVQPLGGEYAARRDVLEVLPFVEGWGVELGLLIDIVDRFGRDAVTQVDLGTREHRNRPARPSWGRRRSRSSRPRCAASTSMHFDAPALDLLRYDRAGHLDPEPVEIRERPPIKTIDRVPRATPANSRAARPASTAASSTSSAARAIGLAGLPHAVGERETSTPARAAIAVARIVGDLARDHARRAAREVSRPREHAGDDFALEARRVELAFAGHHELGSVERGLETDRFGDRVEPGHELRADRGETAGQPARGSATFERGHVDTRARPVLIGEPLEPARQAARPAPAVAPFCGPYTRRGVEERRLDVARDRDARCPAATTRALRPQRARRRSSRSRRPRR